MEQKELRREKIRNIIRNVSVDIYDELYYIIEELFYIEDRLAELRALPMIAIDPKNTSRQRVTPAARQHKELSNLYNAYIKTILSVTKSNTESGDEVSDLMKFLKEKGNFKNNEITARRTP